MLVRQKIAGVIRKGKSHTDPLIAVICFLIFAVYMFGSAPIYNSSENGTVVDEKKIKQVEPPSLKTISTEKGTNTTADDSTEERAKNKPRSVARQAMGPCPQIYGKVTVIVVVVTSSYKRFYHVAQDSLHCYLKSTNYTFILVDLDTDKRVNERCGHNQVLLSQWSMYHIKFYWGIL